MILVPKNCEKNIPARGVRLPPTCSIMIASVATLRFDEFFNWALF